MYTPAVGDWIHSYSPGVWQVFRIVRDVYEFGYSLSSRKKLSKRVLVFSKCLADANWTPSFRIESCADSFVAPLAQQERNRVEKMLASNEDFRAEFEKFYKPESLIVNLTMNLENRAPLERLCQGKLAAEIVNGIPLDRVLELLGVAGLADRIGKMPINTTLQLVCCDHEIRDKEFVFRECRVLPF